MLTITNLFCFLYEKSMAGQFIFAELAQLGRNRGTKRKALLVVQLSGSQSQGVSTMDQTTIGTSS